MAARATGADPKVLAAVIRGAVMPPWPNKRVNGQCPSENPSNTGHSAMCSPDDTHHSAHYGFDLL